jgi:hypothetical protein
MSRQAPPPLGPADAGAKEPASAKIPIMALPFVSEKAKKMIDLVCMPLFFSTVVEWTVGQHLSE